MAYYASLDEAIQQLLSLRLVQAAERRMIDSKGDSLLILINRSTYLSVIYSLFS